MDTRRFRRLALLPVFVAAALFAGCSQAPPKVVGNVQVLGDVESPGYYDVSVGPNARDVVAQAGEVDEEKTRFVLLYHAGQSDTYEAMPLKTFRRHGRTIDLKPDDVVVFARVRKPQVYLSADIATAGALKWVPGMTVGEALDAAKVGGQHRLRTGLRVSPYGEKDVAKPGRGAEPILPGDTILVYDLFHAARPKRMWVEKKARKQALIVGPGEELKGVDQFSR